MRDDRKVEEERERKDKAGKDERTKVRSEKEKKRRRWWWLLLRPDDHSSPTRVRLHGVYYSIPSVFYYYDIVIFLYYYYLRIISTAI